MSKIRLICPNCGAQYEVPIEVIPEGGRDVQCSNCAHTWFQRHPDDDADLAEELGQPAHEETWAPEAEQPPAPVPEVDEPDEDEGDWDQPPAQAQRGLDPGVAEVLREEAERERRQRQAETLESQPDLGLGEPDEDGQARRAREARDRMAKMRGEGSAPETRKPASDLSEAALAGRAAAKAAAAAAESRRELLPDVEEINQTLRATSAPRVTDSAEGRVQVGDDRKAPKGGGFSRGFFLVIVLAALAIGAYAMAPKISQAVPQAQPVLEAYVAQVDALRLWLDGQVTEILTSLDGMSSENPPAGN